MVKAFIKLDYFLTRQGFQSKFYMLDNESQYEPNRKTTGIVFI